MSDAINPKHYKSHPSGVQAIEVCQFLDFSLGNAVKYLWRAGKKPGQLELRRNSDGAAEDLRKASWYLQHALKMQNNGTAPRYRPMIVTALTKVFEHEPEGSVLHDVLDLIVVRIFDGNEPRIIDALVRVEREIEKVTHA